MNSGKEVAWRETEQHEPQRPLQGGRQQLIEESSHWDHLEQHLAEFSSADQEALMKNTEEAFMENTDKVLAFSPDGRWLLTSGEDKAVRLWPLQVNDFVLAQREMEK